MKPNTDKIDDAVLALLHLTSFTEGKGEFAFTRAWKGHDWEALDRLHQKGGQRKGRSVVPAALLRLTPAIWQRDYSLSRSLMAS